MHPDCECVLFLGDGLSDIYDITPDFPRVAFYSVRGNCDYSPIFSHIEKCEIITLKGKKILLTHGDLFGVKSSLGALTAHAVRYGCNIALFGHTHTPYEKYISEWETYLFNPGSISAGYGGHTYGIITLTDTSVLFSHGRVD
jgi:putative phosphoesterase